MAYILEKTAVLKGEVEALKSQGVSKEVVELERDIESFAEERGSLVPCVLQGVSPLDIHSIKLSCADKLQQFIREVESADVEQASFRRCKLKVYKYSCTIKCHGVLIQCLSSCVKLKHS